MKNTFSLSTKELLERYPQVYRPEDNVSAVSTQTQLVATNNDLVKEVNLSPIAVGISGASGFLALHILDTLTHHPGVGKIHAILRSKEKYHQQKEKLKLNFAEDKIEFFEMKNIGDNPAAFEGLQHFIHTAAELHNLKTVSQLYPSNVGLTQELLNHLSPTTRFHYVSTLSVFASSSLRGTHSAYFVKPTELHKIYGGYAQTKFLSEKLVETRPQSRIIRLGLLTPSSFAPHFQSHEFFTLLFARLSELGVYPENFEEAYVDITPVEWAAYQIVEELSSPSYVSHIASREPAKLSDLVKLLNLKPVSESVWQTLIQANPLIKNMERVFLNYTFYKSRALREKSQYFNLDLFQSTGHNWQGQINNECYLETYVKAYLDMSKTKIKDEIII